MPAKKQVTSDMILGAAMQLLREGGASAVSVKALAKRLGCSTQPIYLSFSGMDELRARLIPLAVETFGRELRIESGGEPRLYDIAYVRLAKRERELFKFLFMRENAFQEIKQALAPIVEGAIAELMARYGLGHEQAHFLHDQLWMQAHGIAAMAASEFCDWNMEKVGRMLDECSQLFLGRYEARNVQQ